jgi:hypothetical protein
MDWFEAADAVSIIGAAELAEVYHPVRAPFPPCLFAGIQARAG